MSFGLNSGTKIHSPWSTTVFVWNSADECKKEKEIKDVADVVYQEYQD